MDMQFLWSYLQSWLQSWPRRLIIISIFETWNSKQGPFFCFPETWTTPVMNYTGTKLNFFSGFKLLLTCELLRHLRHKVLKTSPTLSTGNYSFSCCTLAGSSAQNLWPSLRTGHTYLNRNAPKMVFYIYTRPKQKGTFCIEKKFFVSVHAIMATANKVTTEGTSDLKPLIDIFYSNIKICPSDIIIFLFNSPMYILFLKSVREWALWERKHTWM